MADVGDLLARAADPSTPLAELAELAYAHAEVRAAIARNPSTYDDLLTWLAQLGDADVDAALLSRAGASTPVEVPGMVGPPPAAPLTAAPEATGPATAPDHVNSDAAARAQLPIVARFKSAFGRIPFLVKVTSGTAIVAVVITAIACVGASAAAQGRLQTALDDQSQRQAEADAAAEQPTEDVSDPPTDDSVDTPPAPPAASTTGHQIDWTDTTSLGYSIASRVTWGSVGQGSAGDLHPNSSSFTLGSACGYEPTKDAFVAGLWTVTNSTETYDLAVSSSMSVQGRIATPGVSVELEWNTSSGANCGFSTLPYAASIESRADLSSGESIAVPIFIIIKNYYSPTFPGGDTGDLANIKVQQGFTGGANAPLG